MLPIAQVLDDCNIGLELLLTTMVYWTDMIKNTTTCRQPKGASFSAFRRSLSYGLALLFVFVSLSPAQAGMTTGHFTASVHTALNDSPHSGMETGDSDTGHIMIVDTVSMKMVNMGTADDCQSECDCCPGLCSVYLPNNLTSSTFFTSNAALAESAFQGTVATRSLLFRPPISH
jgi:hypothetical protein